MAWQVTNIAAVSNLAAIMFNMKEYLVANCGYVVTSSGDAVGGYSAVGDIITSSTVMATARAWYALARQDGTHAMTVQYGTTTSGRVKVAFLGSTFNTGGNTNSTPATAVATDEAVIVGSGTDAAPVFATSWAGTTQANSRLYGVREDVAPFRWYIFPNGTSGSQVVQHVWMLDYVSPCSYLADSAPYLFHYGRPTTSNYLYADLNGATWFANDFGDRVLSAVEGSAGSQNSPLQVFDRGGARTPDTNAVILAPNVYVRDDTVAAAVGRPFKGGSSMVYWCFSNESSGLRVDTPDGRRYIVLGGVCLPWGAAEGAVAYSPLTTAVASGEYLVIPSLLSQYPDANTAGSGGTPGTLRSVDDSGLLAPPTLTPVASCT